VLPVPLQLTKELECTRKTFSYLKKRIRDSTEKEGRDVPDFKEATIAVVDPIVGHDKRPDVLGDDDGVVPGRYLGVVDDQLADPLLHV